MNANFDTRVHFVNREGRERGGEASLAILQLRGDTLYKILAAIFWMQDDTLALL